MAGVIFPDQSALLLKNECATGRSETGNNRDEKWLSCKWHIFD
jgi:hypothetical protein